MNRLPYLQPWVRAKVAGVLREAMRLLEDGGREN
jgi:hypothetical protein